MCVATRSNRRASTAAAVVMTMSNVQLHLVLYPEHQHCSKGTGIVQCVAHLVYCNEVSF